MNKEMKEILSSAYREFLKIPYAILEIFKDFYGEERVDLYGTITEEEFILYLDNTPMADIIRNFTGLEAAPLNYSEYYRKYPNPEILSSFANDKVTTITSNMEYIKYLPYILPFVTPSQSDNFGILVHFPKVRVENEYGKGVDVEDYWILTPINIEGVGSGWFFMQRSTYELSHMQSDYMHSHVNGIDFEDIQSFRSVCTGTGPINRTMSSLAVSFDESLWQLYCLELERFIKTESISGGPYRRLENIGKTSEDLKISKFTFSRNSTPSRGYFNHKLFAEFTQYLCKSNVLKFKFVNGCYGLAHSFIDTVLIISNSFIEWYNAKYAKDPSLESSRILMREGVISNALISDNAIYFKSDNDRPIEYYTELEGEELFTFKGKPVRLVIKNIDNSIKNTSTILALQHIEFIVRLILTLLNCDYGNSKKTNSGIDKGKTRYRL